MYISHRCMDQYFLLTSNSTCMGIYFKVVGLDSIFACSVVWTSLLTVWGWVFYRTYHYYCARSLSVLCQNLSSPDTDIIFSSCYITHSICHCLLKFSLLPVQFILGAVHKSADKFETENLWWISQITSADFWTAPYLAIMIENVSKSCFTCNKSSWWVPICNDNKIYITHTY